MKKISNYTMIVSALVFFACTSQEEIYRQDSEAAVEYYTIAEEPEFSSQHDISANELAKALSQVVREEGGMRRFIHKESLKQFDGDYNFLIKNAVDKPVDIEKATVKSNAKTESFGNMLRKYLPETKSGEDVLSALQEQYPELQIAVPVHAEEWDPDTYIPVVVFVPEDYQEFVTQTVPGYDAEGNYVEVDAINAPAVPVIVISHNEGIEDFIREPIDSMIVLDPIDIQPQTPSGFGAITGSNSIILSWERTLGARGYHVWRKGQTDSSFHKIATLSGGNNTGYQDTDIIAGYYYQYYLTSYMGSFVSNPTATVTIQAPLTAEGLTSFSVLPGVPQYIECSWASGSTSYSDVVIEHKGPYDPSYSVVYTETGYGTEYDHYIDYSSLGKRHKYRAYRDNGMSQSDAMTDYIYPPYRNINDVSNIYIKRINYQEALEGWLSGRPEFIIIAAYYNEMTGEKCENHVTVRAYSGEEISGKNLKEWRVYNDSEPKWYSMLSIHVIESDFALTAGYFDIDVNYNKKMSEDLELKYAGKISFKDRYNSDYCGTADLCYYDDPEKNLYFSTYSMTIKISETD